MLYILECFGCPRLEKCCRLDIFGHCIACSSWKTCCWKNVNPLCISKQDGCNVIRTAAQRNLAEKEVSVLTLILAHICVYSLCKNIIFTHIFSIIQVFLKTFHIWDVGTGWYRGLKPVNIMKSVFKG